MLKRDYQILSVPKITSKLHYPLIIVSKLKSTAGKKKRKEKVQQQNSIYQGKDTDFRV